MTHDSKLCRRPRALAVLVAVGVSLPGCAMTETTTTVRAQPQPFVQRLRLERPDLVPISGAWHQEALALVGQLAFSRACRTETIRRTKQVQVTDTHPNRRYATGAYITGAALSVLGLALVANAQGKNEHVTCGSGDEAPRAGNTCDSEAGAWRTLGFTTLGAGLGAILGGAIVQTRKSVVTSKDLPTQEEVLLAPEALSCGSPATLKDSTVAATLSSGGKWFGAVDSQGTVRIDLRGSSAERGTIAKLTFEAVAPGAAPLVAVGTPVGEVVLQPAHAESHVPAVARNGK